MVYTVTLNPSLDYIVRVEDFREGIVNRTSSETVLAGGKGINVSLVLHALGCETKAWGFLAGFTGEEIGRRISESGCKEDFIRLREGVSRINVKLKSGAETEINGMGPDIPSDAWDAFLQKLEAELCDGDILVLSGSAPRSLGVLAYAEIAQRVISKNIKLVADTSGEALTAILPYRPFLVKPNHHELGALFGVSVEDTDTAVLYAKKLQEMGACNVLVSMAEKGAVLVTAHAVYWAAAPKGTVLNSVGAGDSMVAGFLAGYLAEDDLADALRLGIAAGSATAFSEDLAKKKDIMNIYSLVFVNRV
ncbi:MAG: 1-phosphofructokinase [Clostridia bacterium]|nr:1-phosphofructokinase [Clostridia bacterium]